MGYFLVLLCSVALGLGVKCNTRILIIWTSWLWQCLGKIVLIISSSVTQSCPTLYDHMECSMAGFLDHHQHPELAQTHVHRVSDAIQPSYPLLSPSPPVFKISQHQRFASEFFASGGQSIGASASASVLPINIQDWFPLGLTDLISFQSKRLSRVFSNTTIQKHQFFATQLSLWSNSHIHTQLLEKL